MWRSVTPRCSANSGMVSRCGSGSRVLAIKAFTFPDYHHGHPVVARSPKQAPARALRFQRQMLRTHVMTLVPPQVPAFTSSSGHESVVV